MDVRVHLVGGSPLLSVSERPVAWFENWVRVDRAALTTIAEMRGIRQ